MEVLGLKEHEKTRHFAQTAITRAAALKAIDMGMSKVEVVINGRGNGRETSIRALKNAGLNIVSIEDKTSIPHNGCRSTKKNVVYKFLTKRIMSTLSCIETYINKFKKIITDHF